jgi:hypothetical protein
MKRTITPAFKNFIIFLAYIFEGGKKYARKWVNLYLIQVLLGKSTSIVYVLNVLEELL